MGGGLACSGAPCWAPCRAPCRARGRKGARAHQEDVEAENELVVAKEEFEHAVDDVQRVDALRLELLHDVEELPQDARAFRQYAGVCACAMRA